MDSRAVQEPDPPDQQVMVAQATPAFPQTAENLEGELAGPILKYMQHLLAELEQLGSATRKATATATAPAPMASSTTPTSAPTTLKGLQGAEAAAKAGAKPKAAPVGDGKKVCQWFGTDNGCRNGRSCTFQHRWTGLSRAERCLLCGSKRHRAKECTNNKEGSSQNEVDLRGLLGRRQRQRLLRGALRWPPPPSLRIRLLPRCPLPLVRPLLQPKQDGCN